VAWAEQLVEWWHQPSKTPTQCTRSNVGRTNIQALLEAMDLGRYRVCQFHIRVHARSRPRGDLAEHVHLAHGLQRSGVACVGSRHSRDEVPVGATVSCIHLFSHITAHMAKQNKKKQQKNVVSTPLNFKLPHTASARTGDRRCPCPNGGVASW